MLKNITIGQFIPLDSPIHHLDPRTKILLTMVFIGLVFVADSPLGYLMLGSFSFLLIIASKLPVKYVLRGLKPLLWIILFTVVINMFMTTGEVVWQWGVLSLTREGIRLGAYMSMRIIFLVLTTSILTLTTSPILLTDGIERLLNPFRKLGVPAHELAMMMTIALRFIPTLLEESDMIMKAQMARGADFESGNLIKRAKSLIPILVPLFVSAFRRADELAMAMESRCYRGGENRTHMRQLKMHWRDLVAAILMVIFSALLIYFGR